MKTTDAHLAPTLEKLIETVFEQGCVKLNSGEYGIPRKIEIDAEGVTVEVHTEREHHIVRPEEIEEIVFVG